MKTFKTKDQGRQTDETQRTQRSIGRTQSGVFFSVTSGLASVTSVTKGLGQIVAFFALALALIPSAHAQFEIRGAGQNRLFVSNTVAGLSLTNGGSGYTSAPSV